MRVSLITFFPAWSPMIFAKLSTVRGCSWTNKRDSITLLTSSLRTLLLPPLIPQEPLDHPQDGIALLGISHPVDLCIGLEPGDLPFGISLGIPLDSPHSLGEIVLALQMRCHLFIAQRLHRLEEGG